MGVRVYWGENYFYAVAVDGKYEYMPYGEYLLIKHHTPGYAVVFGRPPRIMNGRPVCFESSVYEVEHVERFGNNLFVIRTVDGKNLLTDGEIVVKASDGVIRFLREKFGEESLMILTDYRHTNASYVLYSRGKIIVVYDGLYLAVDEKTLEILDAGEKSTVVRVINTETVPTVESIYVVNEGGYIYCGKKYADGVPVYDGGYLGGCEPLRVRGLFPGDFVVRVGKDGVKIVSKEGGRLWPVPKGKKFPDRLPPRDGVVKYVVSSFSGTVRAVFERDGKFYFVKAPANAYLYGSLDFLLGVFGRQLPLRREGKVIVVDYDAVPRARVKEKGERRLRVMGYEAVDLGYALMIRSGDKKVFCPLIESDVRGGKRTFALSMVDYRKLLGDDETSYESFCVFGNMVMLCSSGEFFSENVVNGDPLVRFGGFAVPSGRPTKFMKTYGHLVKDVVYVPDSDGYAVLFDLGEFFVGIDVLGKVFITLPGEDFTVVLAKDYRTVVDFYFSGTFGERYNVRRTSYFKITVAPDGVSVNFVRRGNRAGHVKFIDYPIKRPEMVYWDCGLYLAIRGRPVVKRFDFCVPDGYEVLSVEAERGSYVVKVRNESTGELFIVEAFEGKHFIIEREGENWSFDCNSVDCVYNVLELARAYGWNAIPMLL